MVNRVLGEMTMEKVEENGKKSGDEYTKDGTVDLKGNPVLRLETGRWRTKVRK